ncbi:MAG: 50S ribosomal protein L18 [Candidatus Omnitrophota bacterium]
MRIKGRLRRHRRITKKMKGTAQRPRIVVYRSSKHIYAQLVDDTIHKVITGVSSLSKEVISSLKNINSNEKDDLSQGKKNPESVSLGKQKAKQVGIVIANKAKERGITKACFDRSGYKFHGKIKQVADAAREGGLKF